MRLGDRKCDDDLNNIICCYDKGDCESLTSCPTCQSFLEVLIISPHCSVRQILTLFITHTSIQPVAWTYINDGICDRINFNQKCCFDGEDCLNQENVVCRTCPAYRRGKMLHFVHPWMNNKGIKTDLKCKQHSPKRQVLSRFQVPSGPKEWTGKTIYFNFSSIFGDFFFRFFEEEVSDYLS